jgi:hypothetical protein
MRFVLTTIILAVLAEPATAATSPPLSGTQLIKLCGTDILTCEKLIALIVKTGIDAGQLPACTGTLNLDEITGVSWIGGSFIPRKRRTTSYVP